MKMKKFYSFILVLLLPIALFSQNWDWVKQVTGTNNIAAEVVAVDNNDNVIIGGLRRGDIEFVGSTGPVTMNSGTGFNSPFIAKYSIDGTLLWANEIEGSSAGNIKAITSDNTGNIYAVGSFSGSNYVFYSQDGENDTLDSGGGFDPYLFKYDPGGNLIWVKRFATATGNVRTQSVILDNSGNVILAGFFQAGTLDFGGGISFAFSGANNNGYLAKFDNDGNVIWAKHFPGTWNRLESGLALCQSEGIYATITVRTSVTIEGFGTINSTNGAAYELIFVKFNNDGEAQWIRHAISSVDSYGGNLIASDADGNGYFTGRFRSEITFPNPSGDPISLNSSGGSWDSFIAKYSKDGELLNAQKWGSGGEEFNFGISHHDNILITSGYFTGNMILNPGPSADTLVSNGGRDAYLVSFDSDLNYLSSESAGGTLEDESLSVTFDSEGSPIFGGYFLSSTVDFGATQLTNGGTNQDLFLAKLVDIRIIVDATLVSCFGGTDGALEFSISGGGTPPITYTVHLGVDEIASGTYSTPVSLTGLSAGTYTITATDANLKSKVKYVQITQPDQLTATINVTNITTCYGAAEGQISITGAAGGYGTYEYSINGGTNWQSNNVFENLTAGTYHVKIRDEAFTGCEISLDENVEITEPTEIVILPSPTNITCNGAIDGKIEITASGGTGGPYMYSINDGASFQASNLFEDLPPGSYKIKVDDGDCIKTMPGNVVLSDPDPIVAGSIETEDISCFGLTDGSITVLNVTGGSGPGTYEYSINGIDFFENNGVFTDLPANDYDIFIKDNYNCIIQVATVTIDEPSPITIVSVVSVDITTCFGDLSGSITITATGGTGSLSYSINDGTDWQISNVFTGIGGGTYNIRVKDENDCETIWASNPLTIAQPDEIMISVASVDITTCFGDPSGSITITATGGTGNLSYSIDDGTNWQSSNEFTGLGGGVYNIRVKDENDCETIWASNPLTITQPLEIIISDVEEEHISCFGQTDGKITVTAAGGTGVLEYSINGTDWQASNVFEDLAKDNYTVYVRDENACVVQWSIEVEIIEPAELLISEVNISIETAAGNDGSITVIATGGTSPYDFTLSPGSVTNQTGVFQGLSKGTYNVNVVDANGCSTDSTGIYLSITGIIDNKPIGNLKIFPNPSTGLFVVEFNNQLNKELFIRIYNVVGQVVYTKKINPLDTFVREEISLENEAKGVYMLQISGTDTMVTKKLIIR